MKFKSHLYYEEKDNVPECLKNLKPLEGSKLLFFKNGVCQGVAFSNIYGGPYYPALSMHKNSTVSVNFGPNFKFAPSVSEYQYRGVCKLFLFLYSNYLTCWIPRIRDNSCQISYIFFKVTNINLIIIIVNIIFCAM